MTAENSLGDANLYFENFANEIKYIFSFPISIVTAILQVIFFFLRVLTFPLRICQAVALEYPILMLALFSFILIIFLVFRHIKRYSIINYLLYTLIPYCLSFVFTIFCFFFPHVNVVINILSAALHPISWVLNILRQVSRNTKPIRRTIEVMTPTKYGRHQANSRSSSLHERVQCCICMYREKSILLRPCNHICLCNICLKAVKKEKPAKCPICRVNIESYIDVYF